MKNLNWIMTGLALIALAIALYLLTVHWGWWTAVCLGVGNCEVVNTSRWSELFGIPVALLGSLTYIALAALSAAVARDYYADYARLGRFFIAVVGVAFSAYLTYIELYVLHEICPWCVMQAIIVTIIFILSIVEYFRSPLEVETA